MTCIVFLFNFQLLIINNILIVAGVNNITGYFEVQQPVVMNLMDSILWCNCSYVECRFGFDKFSADKIASLGLRVTQTNLSRSRNHSRMYTV
jgi:hypothetical protein